MFKIRTKQNGTTTKKKQPKKAKLNKHKTISIPGKDGIYYISKHTVSSRLSGPMTAAKRHEKAKQEQKKQIQQEVEKKRQNMLFPEKHMSNVIDTVVNAVPFDQAAGEGHSSRFDHLEAHERKYGLQQQQQDNDINPQPSGGALDEHGDVVFGLKHRSFSKKEDALITPLLTQVSLDPQKDYKFSKRRDLIYKLNLDDPYWKQKASLFNHWALRKFRPVFHQQFQLLLIHYGVIEYPQTQHDWLFPQDHILKGLLNHGLIMHRDDNRSISPKLMKKTNDQLEELFTYLRALGVLDLTDNPNSPHRNTSYDALAEMRRQSRLNDDNGEDGGGSNGPVELQPEDLIDYFQEFEWRPGVAHPYMPFIPHRYHTDPTLSTKEELVRLMKEYRSLHNNVEDAENLKFETVLDVVKKCLHMAGAVDFQTFVITKEKPHTHVHLRNNVDNIPPRGDTIDALYTYNTISPMNVDEDDVMRIEDGLPPAIQLHEDPDTGELLAIENPIDEEGKLIPHGDDYIPQPATLQDLNYTANHKIIRGLVNMSQRLEKLTPLSLSNMKQLLILIESMKRQDVLTQWFEMDSHNFLLYRQLQHVFLETERTFRQEAFQRELKLESLVGGFNPHEDPELDANYRKEREKKFKFKKLGLLDPDRDSNQPAPPLSVKDLLEIDKQLDLYGGTFNKELPLPDQKKVQEIEREQMNLFRKYGFTQADMDNLVVLITDLFLQNLNMLRYLFQPYQRELYTTVISNIVKPELYQRWSIDRRRALIGKDNKQYKDPKLQEEEEKKKKPEYRVDPKTGKLKRLIGSKLTPEHVFIQVNDEQNETSDYDGYLAETPPPNASPDAHLDFYKRIKHKPGFLWETYDVNALNKLWTISSNDFYLKAEEHKAYNIILKTPNLSPKSLFLEHLIGYLDTNGFLIKEKQLKRQSRKLIHGELPTNPTELLSKEDDYENKTGENTLIDGFSTTEHRGNGDLGPIARQKKRNAELYGVEENNSEDSEGGDDPGLGALNLKHVYQIYLDYNGLNHVKHDPERRRFEREESMRREYLEKKKKEDEQYELLRGLGQDTSRLLNTPDLPIPMKPLQSQRKFAVSFDKIKQRLIDVFINAGVMSKRKHPLVITNQDALRAGTATQPEYDPTKQKSALPPQFYKNTTFVGYIYELPQKYQIFYRRDVAQGKPTPFDPYLVPQDLIPPGEDDLDGSIAAENASMGGPKIKVFLKTYEMEIIGRLLHHGVIGHEELFQKYELSSITPIRLDIYNDTMKEVIDDIYQNYKLPLHYNTVHWDTIRNFMIQDAKRNGNEEEAQEMENSSDLLRSPIDRLLDGVLLTENITQQITEKFGDFYKPSETTSRTNPKKNNKNGNKELDNLMNNNDDDELLFLKDPVKTFPFVFNDHEMAKIIRQQNKELRGLGLDNSILPGHVVIASETIYPHYNDPSRGITLDNDADLDERGLLLKQQREKDKAKRREEYQRIKAEELAEKEKKLRKDLNVKQQDDDNSNNDDDKSEFLLDGDNNDKKQTKQRKTNSKDNNKNNHNKNNTEDEYEDAFENTEEQVEALKIQVRETLKQRSENSLRLDEFADVASEDIGVDVDPRNIEYIHKRVGFVQANDVVLDIIQPEFQKKLMEERKREILGERYITFKERIRGIKQKFLEKRVTQYYKNKNDTNNDSNNLKLKEQENNNQSINKPSIVQANPMLNNVFDLVKNNTLPLSHIQNAVSNTRNKVLNTNNNDEKRGDGNSNDNDNDDSEDIPNQFNEDEEFIKHFGDSYAFLTKPISGIKIKVRYDVWERNKRNDELLKLNDVDVFTMNLHELRREMISGDNIQHDLLYNFALENPHIWDQVTRDMHLVKPYFPSMPFNEQINEALLAEVKCLVSNLRCQKLLKKQLFYDFYTVYNIIQKEGNNVASEFLQPVTNDRKQIRKQINNVFNSLEIMYPDPTKQQRGEDDGGVYDGDTMPFVEIAYNNLLLNDKQLNKKNRKLFFKRMQKFIDIRTQKVTDEFINGNMDVTFENVDLTVENATGYYPTTSDGDDNDGSSDDYSSEMYTDYTEDGGDDDDGSNNDDGDDYTDSDFFTEDLFESLEQKYAPKESKQQSKQPQQQQHSQKHQDNVHYNNSNNNNNEPLEAQIVTDDDNDVNTYNQRSSSSMGVTPESLFARFAQSTTTLNNNNKSNTSSSSTTTRTIPVADDAYEKWINSLNSGRNNKGGKDDI